jgi:hypothetical protein
LEDAAACDAVMRGLPDSSDEPARHCAYNARLGPEAEVWMAVSRQEKCSRMRLRRLLARKRAAHLSQVLR